MARQVGGVRTAFPANKMVIIPAFVAVPEGLTFTVGQITSTTRGGGLAATVSEETQIQSRKTAALALTTQTLAPALQGNEDRWLGSFSSS